MSEHPTHPLVDMLTSKVGIAFLWTGNAIAAIFSYASQIALILTIIATIANLFFTFRDKWWRDPYRKARRARRRRR